MKRISALILLLFASFCWGQARPEAPKPSVGKTLIVLQLATVAADSYATAHDFTPHFRELDPLARPFVQSRTTLAVSSAVGVAGAIFLEYSLQKRHPKLARALALGMIAGHSGGTVTSVVGHYVRLGGK